MIKNAEGKINGHITYARITIQKKAPVDVIFPLATNLQNGLINDCTVKGKRTYVRMLIQKKEKNK